MLALVVITLLCSSYCAVQGMAVPQKMVVLDDKANWANLWKYNQKHNPLISRTSNSNESVLDIIIRVNAEERGHKSTARSGDSNIFLLEADIAMNKSEAMKLINGQGNNRGKRAVMKKTNRNLWGRYLAYVIDNRLSSTAKSVIRSAIREWEQTLPCMGKWTDVTTKSKPRDYLHFFQGGGCYSQVGRQGGRQKVSIGRGCEYHGIAVHEIGHAMGLWHEQSRPDRDSYVKINWGNIIPGMQFNFNKYTTARIDSLGERYDFGSVMHYGATAFAKSRGVRTIVNIRNNERLGQRKGLSASDKKQVQSLYGCSTTGTKRPSVCSNTPTHNNWCSESGKLGLCSNSLFKQYMTTHCCSTCRKTTPAPSGCVDKQSRSNCEGWKKTGYCIKGSQYRPYMMTNCCKTCGPAVTKPNCKDKNTKCPSWKTRNFCTDSRYLKYMRTNCQKSCGYCNST